MKEIFFRSIMMTPHPITRSLWLAMVVVFLTATPAWAFRTITLSASPTVIAIGDSTTLTASLQDLPADPNPVGISGILVTFKQGGTVVDTAASDGNGNAVLQDVTPSDAGTIQYTATAPGYPNSDPTSVTVVAVKSLKVTGTGVTVITDPEPDPGDPPGTTAYSVPEDDTSSTTITATPDPQLDEGQLPSSWTLTGGDGTGKLVRTIANTDHNTKIVVTATCGTSKKRAKIYIISTKFKVQITAFIPYDHVSFLGFLFEGDDAGHSIGRTSFRTRQNDTLPRLGQTWMMPLLKTMKLA